MTENLNNKIEITLPDGTDCVFYMRPGSSPAAFAVLDEHAARLAGVKITGDMPDEDMIEAARELHDIFFPDPASTNENMQMILAGPHDRVDWYRDVSWVRQVSIIADWLTRTRADLRRAMRDEQERLSAIMRRFDSGEEVPDGEGT